MEWWIPRAHWLASSDESVKKLELGKGLPIQPLAFDSQAHNPTAHVHTPLLRLGGEQITLSAPQQRENNRPNA